jgi:hypothetical protein
MRGSGAFSATSIRRVSAAAIAANATSTPPPILSHVIAFILAEGRKETGLRMEIRGDPDWRRTPHVSKAGQIERTNLNEAVPETSPNRTAITELIFNHRSHCRSSRRELRRMDACGSTDFAESWPRFY